MILCLSYILFKNGGEMKKKILNVKDHEVVFFENEKEEYISLTDIAKYRNSSEPYAIINNWIRNRSVIEFLGLWEKLNNPGFKPLEFERFKTESGTNYFVLSPQKWINTTNSIGVVSKSGRYGGTFAHKDIAFEFASWISSEFKLYLITEFQRLKNEESITKNLEWSFQRVLTKINYRIHTDAIKENLIPLELSKYQVQIVYANEADILNMAMFGKTAKQWRETNKDKSGNIRDYATLEQLVVLSNLESMNSILIHQNISQNERLVQLNKVAIIQMKSLIQNKDIKSLKSLK